MIVTQIIEEWTRNGRLPGVALLVQKGRQILFEYASGYADVQRKIAASVNHLWVTASLAKPVATSALMQIVDRGAIDLNQPVQEMLPDFQHSNVLVRHLITHTSGLGPMEPEQQIIDRLGRIRAIGAGGLLFEPGTRCSYSTPAFDLVEAIVCRFSGMTWSEYTQRNIFEPLGMHNTSYQPRAEWEDRVPVVYDEQDHVDPWWNNRDLRAIGLAGGGLFSTLHDLASFAQVFLDDGEPILSRQNARAMVTLQTAGLFNLEGLPQTWGFGWYLNQDGGNGFGPLSRNAFGHGGITGTWMCADPARQLIVVKLANRLHIPLEDSALMQSHMLTAITKNFNATSQ